jgi:hypothetical protein
MKKLWPRLESYEFLASHPNTGSRGENIHSYVKRTCILLMRYWPQLSLLLCKSQGLFLFFCPKTWNKPKTFFLHFCKPHSTLSPPKQYFSSSLCWEIALHKLFMDTFLKYSKHELLIITSFYFSIIWFQQTWVYCLELLFTFQFLYCPLHRPVISSLLSCRRTHLE